jgi:hypothetical protein
MDRTLTQQILFGAHDDDLTAISNAVQERRKLLRQHQRAEARLTIQVGDRGTLTGIRPKYVEGAEVEVVEAPKRSRVLARFIEPVDPRVIARFGRTTNIPLTCFKATTGSTVS